MGGGRWARLRWRIELAVALFRHTPETALPALLGLWFVLRLAALFALGDASPAGLLVATALGLVLALVVATRWWSSRVIAAMRKVATPLQDALGVIHTERLVMRPAARDDAAAFAAVLDAEVVEANGYTRRHVRSAVEAIRFGVRDPDRLLLLVTDRTTGAVFGDVSVHTPRGGEDYWHLGWSMGPGARGRGYGTEAVGAVLAALHAHGIDRVWVGTAPDNVGVHRVLHKVGARYVETRPHTLPNGASIESDWFAHDSEDDAGVLE